MPPELPGAKIESAVHELNSKGGTVPLPKVHRLPKRRRRPCFQTGNSRPKRPEWRVFKKQPFLEGQDAKLRLNLSELSYSSDFSLLKALQMYGMYGQITVMAEALSSSGGEKHEWHPTWPHTHKKCRQGCLVKPWYTGKLSNIAMEYPHVS